ncbi:GNAT family acetyltransferase [Tothia fuscella]|uniref:GNAT family acetyltransferase n=1 Tax=Tothia fuscella TaxID=1048955 RepID=A0A9P4NVN1_9PEZI|nr:GNAT family acetyltransferase [Tothia fuscella]
MTMSVANAFQSKSLVFRAIEDNEEDRAFMHSLWLDPESYYLNNYLQLLKPISRRNYDIHNESKKSNRLLNVLICIPAHVKCSGTQQESSCRPEKPTPIGFVNLHGLSQDHRQHRTLDIGILIAPQYRGHGYGSDAIRWVLNWGFRTAGLHRIGLQSGSFNTGAIVIWQRLGFNEDGRDREAVWENGGWHDEVRFSILEDEWCAMIEKDTDEDTTPTSEYT